ncbi:MAG TPA: hypothetical protein VE081_08195 [Sporichthyaceae bacterium]|nr:hypothetical protein [Sporichthyaceae bacterium]
MACCLAVALVIAVVRAAWFRVFPARRPARGGFAPPARRPAPGPVPSGAIAAAPVQLGVRGAGPTWPASAGFLVVGALLGVAGYAATAEAAIGTRLVPAPPLERLVVVVTVLSVAAVLVARQRRRRRGEPVGGRADRARPERRPGSGLIVAGIGWSVASVVDMHLLGLVPLGAGHLHGTSPGMSHGMSAGVSAAAGHGFGPVELVLHGPGLVAVALGCLLALGAGLRRRSLGPLSPRPLRAT